MIAATPDKPIEIAPITLTPVNSSNIEAIAFDDAIGGLFVKFKSGKIFLYAGVTPDHYKKLGTAKSIGSHFASEIKGKFPEQEVKFITKGEDDGKAETDKRNDHGTEQPDQTAATGSSLGDILGSALSKDQEATGGAKSDDLPDNPNLPTDGPFIKARTVDKVDVSKSDRLDGIKAKLAENGIEFEYEREVDKNGVDHWNYTATLIERKSFTGRVIENVTEKEEIQVIADIRDNLLTSP